MFRSAKITTIILLVGGLFYLDTIAQDFPLPGDQNPGLFEHKDIFISGNDNTHTFRIPAIVTAPNGDLLVAMDARRENAGDLMYSRDIDIVIKRSADNGNTWSPMETILNLPDGEPVSDPSMIVDDSTGTIFIFYNYMNRDTADGEYRFFVQSSIDNGETWSEYRDFTEEVSKPGWETHFKFITSGRGIQTRDGTLLHTIVNLSEGLHVFGSDNNGQSWYLKDVPINPANESKIIELNNGNLLINSRVNGQGKRYIHSSDDNGSSWAGNYDDALEDPGCNASIIRFTSVSNGFSKNRLLFSNANSSSARENMAVRISYDEGQTWSPGKTLYSGSSAYSDLTILQDGTIGLVYEADNYASIRFARFSLEWLTDGADSLQNPTFLATNGFQNSKLEIHQSPGNLRVNYGTPRPFQLKIISPIGKIMNYSTGENHYLDTSNWKNGIYGFFAADNNRSASTLIYIKN